MKIILISMIIYKGNTVFLRKRNKKPFFYKLNKPKEYKCVIIYSCK